MPLKKPDDTGYPKCPDSVFADVPASAPLLKVYDYGPLGARFFKRSLPVQSLSVIRYEVMDRAKIACNVCGGGKTLISQLNTDDGLPVSLYTLWTDPHLP